MEQSIQPQKQITTEIVVATINVALTRAQIPIQMLNDMESKLVLNEDNLPEVAKFLDTVKQARKIVDTEHGVIKDPYLKATQAIDSSRREMLSTLEFKRVSEWYVSKCRELEQRKREAELEQKRKQQIALLIDNSMLDFSQQIAACVSDKQLNDVERMINLEKANKHRYQDLYPVAFEKYSSLTSLLTIQKECIREAAKLEKKRADAEKKGDDEEILRLNDEQFKLSEKIDDAKVAVQESAINQTISTPIEATEIIPEVKSKMARWTWEVEDIKTVAKKMPDWVKIETVDTKINEFMRASKDGWKGKEEVVVNGIRFFLNRTY